jgi:hypothetical protein
LTSFASVKCEATASTGQTVKFELAGGVLPWGIILNTDGTFTGTPEPKTHFDQRYGDDQGIR